MVLKLICVYMYYVYVHACGYIKIYTHTYIHTPLYIYVYETMITNYCHLL